MLDFSPHYFQDRRLPQDCRLAGYAALSHVLDVKIPLRQPASCVYERYSKNSEPVLKQGFHCYSKRYWPGDTLEDHFVFLLRYEVIDLLCLRFILQAFPKQDLEHMIENKPTGIYVRKVWFLYEYLLGDCLEVQDLQNSKAQPLLDSEKYFTKDVGVLSKRHRIYNNFLGHQNFCPIIRKTEKLIGFVTADLDEKLAHHMKQASSALISRAASFMLLADTKASFAIEGERPPRSRLERWLKAVSAAGRNYLDLEELIRLHRVLIADDRFTTIGVRQEEVFLGERDAFNEPLPEFIGARRQDLQCLLEGFFTAIQSLETSGVHPALQATALAFGFVYIHPHADGNGRLHRFILHHILARQKYTPQGMIFPISAILLERIEDYRTILVNHSRVLMEYIDWQSDEKGNVAILNDTSALYKYFDCTEASEFIFECVEQAILKSIPEEMEFLKCYDEATVRIKNFVEMPDEQVKRLINYIKGNAGSLGNKRRRNEFHKLTDEEVEYIEAIVKQYLI